MTASIVFFSALGWDGLRGAFFLASTISAPISCRLAAEALADLREPVLLLLVHVVPDVLDEHGGLGVEPLVVGLHRGELDDQHVGDVVLLVGLQDVVLEVRQQLADARVHHLVLDVGVHGEQLDDLVDELALGGVRVLAGLLEVAERPCGSPCGRP